MENPIKMDDLGVPLFLETPKYPHFDSSVFLRRITWAADQQLIIPSLVHWRLFSAQNMSFKTRNSKTNHRRRRLSSGKMCSKYLQCSGMQQLGPRIPVRNSSYFHPCCSHENFAPPHHFALGVHGCFQENSSKSRCESWVWRDVFEISLRSVVVVEMFSRHTWLVLFWWIKQDHHCTGYLFA